MKESFFLPTCHARFCESDSHTSLLAAHIMAIGINDYPSRSFGMLSGCLYVRTLNSPSLVIGSGGLSHVQLSRYKGEAGACLSPKSHLVIYRLHYYYSSFTGDCKGFFMNFIQFSTIYKTRNCVLCNTHMASYRTLWTLWDALGRSVGSGTLCRLWDAL